MDSITVTTLHEQELINAIKNFGVHKLILGAVSGAVMTQCGEPYSPVAFTLADPKIYYIRNLPSPNAIMRFNADFYNKGMEFYVQYESDSNSLEIYSVGYNQSIREELSKNNPLTDQELRVFINTIRDFFRHNYPNIVFPDSL